MDLKIIWIINSWTIKIILYFESHHFESLYLAKFFNIYFNQIILSVYELNESSANHRPHLDEAGHIEELVEMIKRNLEDQWPAMRKREGPR